MNKFICAVFSAFLLTSCGKRTYNLKLKAMEPTIPENSSIVVDKKAYETDTPKRYDIVAFKPVFSKMPGAKMTWIFRVLGLPGEKVEITNSSVAINGRLISPPTKSVKYLPLKGTYTKMVLKSDEYYLVGDNTKLANDSRYIGPIKENTIIGKVVKINP